jgi:maltooligosyltrehalose trehalohydrolase
MALLGAISVNDVEAQFRLWAPRPRTVELQLDGETFPLEPEGEGFYSAVVPARPGARYTYLLDEHDYPDPCSRAQPDGVLGRSELVDIGFSEGIAPWQAPPLEDLVIYELHVGTFSVPGTFRAVIERLPALRELGVRAIELMPIATFPGRRNWGYDGVYTWAPHPVYGGPQGFAELVDAAHRADLGVIVDVVYNHLGPGSDAINAFGPYLTERPASFWGQALNYAETGVREWAIQNAELWVRDYGVDGLRIDAAHAVFDDRDPHVLAELATRVHRLKSTAFVIAEMETGDRRPIERWGHDAQWGDELHHAIHVLLTGEHEGYYAPYGTVADLARAFGRDCASRFIVSAQNHDQVGNRAFGDRLHGDKLRLAAFCVLLSPGTPMLFMGEEYDEASPFQFFTDHIDPTVAAATRTGRRREFADFSAFAGAEIPDPQAEATFLASKLHPERGDDGTRAYYRELLALRATLRGSPVETSLDEARHFFRVRRGAVELLMNFSDDEVDGVPPWTGVVRS